MNRISFGSVETFSRHTDDMERVLSKSDGLTDHGGAAPEETILSVIGEHGYLVIG
jgi:hypothetical protein